MKPMVMPKGDAPWKKEDREWFEKNPSDRYRVRDPLPNELAFSELNSLGLNQAQFSLYQACASISGADIKMLVCQFRPGVRARSLLLAREENGKTVYLRETLVDEGLEEEEIDLNEYVEKLTVAMKAANYEALEEQQPVAPDDCEYCHTVLKTGDVAHMFHTEKGPLYVCRTCTPEARGKGLREYGVTNYIHKDHEHTPLEELRRRFRRT